MKCPNCRTRLETVLNISKERDPKATGGRKSQPKCPVCKVNFRPTFRVAIGAPKPRKIDMKKAKAMLEAGQSQADVAAQFEVSSAAVCKAFQREAKKENDVLLPKGEVGE